MSYCKGGVCPTDRRFLLFTMDTCSHCVQLKSKLGSILGYIDVISLNGLPWTSSEMKWFNAISPNRSVPVYVEVVGTSNPVLDMKTVRSGSYEIEKYLKSKFHY